MAQWFELELSNTWSIDFFLAIAIFLINDDNEFLCYDYKSARECFDNMVNEDRKKAADIPNIRHMLSSTVYDRWDEGEAYCLSHLTILLIEFIEENGKLVKKVS